MDRKLFRRTDIIILIILLTISAIFFFAMTDDKGEIAEIWIDGKVYRSFDLSEPFELSLDNGVTLMGDGDSAWFDNSDCKDKVCINTGKLSHDGQWAACLPNSTVLKIVKGDGNVDTVS